MTVTKTKKSIGESSLVLAHVDGEGLEVVELAGETHGTAVDEHPVASLVGNLVHLKDTLALHGGLGLHEEVLANAHRPATAHSGHNTHVLVDESVDLVGGVGDLDGLATEDGLESRCASTEALGLTGTHGGEASNGVQEVTEGGQVAALALGSVGLEGQVVVGDLLVVALDHLEELVTSALNTLGDLDQDGALGAGEVLAGTVSGTLGTGLTHLDGAHELLVE